MPILNTVPRYGSLENAIALIKQNSPRITHLSVRYEKLTPADIIHLCDALTQNTKLTSLDLSYNYIGYETLTCADIIRLCDALALNTTLTTLNVEGNNIGTEGAKALALNTALTTLNVGGNNIGDEGDALIRQSIQRNQKTVISLYVLATIKEYRDSPTLPVLHLDMLYHIATFLVPEKTALKLRLFAEPRFFIRQTVTSPPSLEVGEPQEAEKVTQTNQTNTV